MASTPLTVPAGTTTIYAAEDGYLDAAGNPTTDAAVSGSYVVDNGATVVPDATGTTAVITLTGQPGTTTVAWSGKNASGGTITASNTVTVEAPVAPPVAPAVTANLQLSTEAPATAAPAAPAAPPADPTPPAAPAGTMAAR